MPATRSNPSGSADPAPRSAPSPPSPPAPSSRCRSRGAASSGPRPVSTIGKVDFETPLAIPPLAASTVDADGTRVFSAGRPGGRPPSSHRACASDTWGFNGSYLGPTLVAKRGEHVARRRRQLARRPTTVHWHGMHLPAEMDGGPHQMVEPDATWSPEWDIDQQAATLWYHPHPHGETESHVARGLAGMFLVQDDAEAALPLPREYGVDDMPRHRAGHRLLRRRRA